MMKLKRIHYLFGLIITLFIVLHLSNHAISILGIDEHIALMEFLRHFYRHPIIETILILAVTVQVFSGLQLFRVRRKTAATFFQKLHLWTGFYLAIFFVFHLMAVMAGRFVLHLDTNFYFGTAGLNTFPFNLFFIPYYGLAIISFFGHISSIHHSKMQKMVFGISPLTQARVILLFGIALTLIVFYGLTNGFKGVLIPEEYGVLIGK